MQCSLNETQPERRQPATRLREYPALTLSCFFPTPQEGIGIADDVRPGRVRFEWPKSVTVLTTHAGLRRFELLGKIRGFLAQNRLAKCAHTTTVGAQANKKKENVDGTTKGGKAGSVTGLGK